MKEKWFLIKHCLRGKCYAEENFHLRFWQKWFYIIKVTVCITLGRIFKGSENRWIRGEFIVVGCHSFHSFHNYSIGTDDISFVNITVGYGWKNWFYYEISDGWL